MRARALDDEDRVVGIVGEGALVDPAVEQVARARDVALREVAGAADVEQDEARLAGRELGVDVPDRAKTAETQ